MVFGIIVELIDEAIVINGGKALRYEMGKRIYEEREFLADLVCLEYEVKRIS